MKILQKICFVLLLTTFSSVYGGDCFKDKDVDDCRVKAKSGFFTKGNAKAQFNLGLMYAYGQGVPQDYKEAVKWYRKSAEQGIVEAQINLGVMYLKGKGVIRDKVMAVMYFSIAAVGGNELAIKNRDKVWYTMYPKKYEKSQELAREWVRTHQ